MKAIGLILFALLMTPINALMTAATASKLWGWYVARDLGSGPSHAAWFGLASIFSLVLAPSLVALAKEQVTEEKFFSTHFTRIIAVPVGCVLALAFGWLTGFVIGWV